MHLRHAFAAKRARKPQAPVCRQAPRTPGCRVSVAQKALSLITLPGSAHCRVCRVPTTARVCGGVRAASDRAPATLPPHVARWLRLGSHMALLLRRQGIEQAEATGWRRNRLQCSTCGGSGAVQTAEGLLMSSGGVVWRIPDPRSHNSPPARRAVPQRHICRAAGRRKPTRGCPAHVRCAGRGRRFRDLGSILRQGRETGMRLRLQALQPERSKDPPHPSGWGGLHLCVSRLSDQGSAESVRSCSSSRTPSTAPCTCCHRLSSECPPPYQAEQVDTVTSRTTF